jgi:hypothetical protein
VVGLQALSIVLEYNPHGNYITKYVMAWGIFKANQNYNQRSEDGTVNDFKITTFSKHIQARILSVQLPNTLTAPPSPPHLRMSLLFTCR